MVKLPRVCYDLARKILNIKASNLQHLSRLSMLDFLMMLWVKPVVVEFNHKVTGFLWVWRTTLQVTQNSMAALT